MHGCGPSNILILKSLSAHLMFVGLHNQSSLSTMTRVMIQRSLLRLADQPLTIHSTALGTLFTRLVRPIITMVMTTHLQLNAVCKPMNTNMDTELVKKKNLSIKNTQTTKLFIKQYKWKVILFVKKR